MGVQPPGRHALLLPERPRHAPDQSRILGRKAPGPGARGLVPVLIEEFHERVKEWAIEACDVESFGDIPEDRRDDLESLLDAGDEYEAVAEQRRFQSDWLDLTDFWDGRHPCQRVRDHYLFACYAITWTVRLYDEQRPTEAEAS